ncbi:phospholipase C, phosphocholine-specific [Gluconacetobacter azotocaptans]|uniref:phosphocholine-specific phospholipase C n=1 Tax=Gluconacetobacter azotocaptans TaxID=142834 RepID=UPI001956C905|nr:phospholipase C, phosphocholine-specific [Gluconacetobacter azotocaptans]MBM9400728.1 phospholipase C, phosphocholine-specific [Gluconacetobacter azotocaptans]
MALPSDQGRRQFLKFSAAAAAVASGLVPDNVRRALAIPPRRMTGTLHDVEHVVILMQENRSFDHYFGTLRGVRGYGDPRAVTLPDGSSAFRQPRDGGGAVLPFRFNTEKTSAECLPSLNHDWKGSQADWNSWDVWIRHKTDMTMGYFTRQDIPYYYALADAFTICDAYHASIFGPTNPNRLFLFSGTSGLAVGHDGKQVIENVDDGNWSADMAHDRKDFAPFRWTTYADRLTEHGVSWKIYQEYDNFGDNPLASFAQFRNLDRASHRFANARAIVPGSTAENKDNSEGRFLIEAFERDVASGRLPQVSWIVPPTALSEHPNAPPGYGEFLISRMMDVLVRHPDVWARTVFILNYDENDGFFDHVPAPVPALDPSQGESTVPVTGESFHGVPVGLGPRVPMIVVSPWTKGGWVNSELFDHTSVLRFLERRFGVSEPNITPWRRAVAGDLTSIFDFAQTDRSWPGPLPDTDAYPAATRGSCMLPDRPVVPADQAMPAQEPGQRPARPLPYDLTATAEPGPGSISLTFASAGAAGAVFSLYDGDAAGPRHYTVGARSRLTTHVVAGDAPLRIQGPNGFLREFRMAGAAATLPVVAERYEPARDCIVLTVRNPDMAPMDVRIAAADGAAGQQYTIPAGGQIDSVWPIAVTDHWYDLSVHLDGRAQPVARLAGHMETGRPSRSDPMIGRAGV